MLRLAYLPHNTSDVTPVDISPCVYSNLLMTHNPGETPGTALPFPLN